MNDIWVSDCMTRSVNTCSMDTTLAEVAEELRVHAFSCLIIEDGGLPIGIITERGLLTIMADVLEQENWSMMPVEHFMSKIITYREDLTLMEIVGEMTKAKVRHAPIVNPKGKLVGILTQTDIIAGFYRAGRDADQE